MHRSQLGGGWQRYAASNVSQSPHAASTACESLTIQHYLMESGADVDLTHLDELQASVVQFGGALLLSALCEPSIETVAFARRDEVIRLLEQSLATLLKGQKEEAELVDSGTFLTIPLTLGGRGSVIFIVRLCWKDRYGAALSKVVCRSTIDIPDHHRRHCAAWFSGQAARLAQTSDQMLHSIHRSAYGRDA